MLWAAIAIPINKTYLSGPYLPVGLNKRLQYLVNQIRTRAKKIILAILSSSIGMIKVEL